MLMTGKVYALSDLHGHYDALMAMLKKIRFSDRTSSTSWGTAMTGGRRPWRSTTLSSSTRTIFFS